MTKPKSYRDLGQRHILSRVIEWDGDLKNAYIELPLLRNPILVCVDNDDQTQALTVKMQHHVRTDDTKAYAQIGEGTDGVVRVEYDEPGIAGNVYSLRAVIPEVDEPSDIEVTLVGNVITVELAMKSDGDDGFEPDSDKNTAELIAAEIDDLEDFTATHSGTGETALTTAITAVPFTGGRTDIFASVAKMADGAEESFTVPSSVRRVYGPIGSFPKFLGGRLAISAGSAPADGKTTIVHVLEVI